MPWLSAYHMYLRCDLSMIMVFVGSRDGSGVWYGGGGGGGRNNRAVAAVMALMEVVDAEVVAESCMAVGVILWFAVAPVERGGVGGVE